MLGRRRRGGWTPRPQSLNNRAELFVAGGRITGLIAGYLLLVQILLMSRVGLLERWVGTELLTRWHRDFGGVARGGGRSRTRR